MTISNFPIRIRRRRARKRMCNSRPIIKCFTRSDQPNNLLVVGSYNPQLIIPLPLFVATAAPSWPAAQVGSPRSMGAFLLNVRLWVLLASIVPRCVRGDDAESNFGAAAEGGCAYRVEHGGLLLLRRGAGTRKAA